MRGNMDYLKNLATVLFYARNMYDLKKAHLETLFAVRHEGVFVWRRLQVISPHHHLWGTILGDLVRMGYINDIHDTRKNNKSFFKGFWEITPKGEAVVDECYKLLMGIEVYNPDVLGRENYLGRKVKRNLRIIEEAHDAMIAEVSAKYTEDEIEAFLRKQDGEYAYKGGSTLNRVKREGGVTHQPQ